MNGPPDERLRQFYAGGIERRRAPGREACPAPEALAELVHQRGAETIRLATLDHVMACPDCRREFELLRAFDVGAAAARPWYTRHLLAVAASVTLLIGTGVLWRAVSPSPDVFRDSGAALTLLSPTGNVSASQARTLQWNAMPGAVRYQLEITDPGGTLVHRATADAPDYTVPDSVVLESEVEYRWWVMAFVDGGRRRSTAAAFVIR